LTEKTLKGLSQSGIWDVTFVLIELARCKKPARRNKGFIELVDDGGLADTRIPRNQHQLGPVAGYDTVEGGEQCLDLRFSPVQFLGDQQAVGYVVLAEQEFGDAVLRFPLRKTALKITLQAERGLVPLLGSFGQ